MNTQLFKTFIYVLRKSSIGVAFLLLTALGQQAKAAVYTYDSATPSQLITHVDTACTSTLNVNFNVTDVFNVGDLDVGLNISTPYRGDIEARLISPLGTSVYILRDDGSGYDDWDVTLDDAAANTNYYATMNTAAPLYDVSLSPDNPLNTFDGEAANGIWTLELCDDASTNDSTFNSARLTFDDTPKPIVDLSVTQSFSSITPSYDDLLTVTVSVINSSAGAAEGVTLIVAQPTSSTYNGYAQTSVTAGSYVNSSQIWSVGSVAAGQTETLTYTVPAKAGTGSFYAYLNTASNSDPDSTPGNTISSEDDYAIQSITTSPALGHVPAGGRNICYKDVSELALDGEPNTWDKLANNAYFGAGGSVAPEDLAHTGFWTINTTTLTDFSCDIWLGGGSPDETATETTQIYSWLGSGNRYVIGACDYTSNDICNDVRSNVDIPNGGVTIDSALTYNPLGCGGALTVNTYGGASTYFTPQAGDVVLATHDPGGEPAIITDAINGGTFLLLPDADMLGQSGASPIGSGATATTDQAKLVLNTFKLALDEIAGRTINSCSADFNNPPGTISGFVYTDSNGDDTYQSGTETPLQNVTVTIYGDPATPADPSDDFLIASVETDVNGAYSFSVSQDNSYRIEVDTADTDLAGFAAGTPNPINSVTVVSGGSTANQNFGFDSTVTASCSGYSATIYDPNTTLTDTGYDGFSSSPTNPIGTFPYTEFENTAQHLSIQVTEWGSASLMTDGIGDDSGYAGSTLPDADWDRAVDFRRTIQADEAGAYSVNLNAGDDHVFIFVNGTPVYSQANAFSVAPTALANLSLAAGDELIIRVVEEHLGNTTLDITITPLFTSNCSSVDYGDAPSDLSAVDADLNPAYPTLIADGGASHTIGGATFLGAAVDAETDGQPNTAATGDTDDGVAFPTLGTNDVLMLGQSNSITVTASTPGFLNAWMDINQDGDWSDAGEQLFSNQALNAGNNALAISTATTQPTGDTYLRFRFTSTAVATPLPTGALPDGEVEDYRVAIVLPEAGACSSGLINGGFESPASGFGQYNEDAVPGWATLANNPAATSPEESNGFLARNRIEIWNNGFNSVPSYEGNQFAEINAHVAGALYQDLETTPGTVISYQFAHRGRDGNDTVDVFIGAPGATNSQTGGVGYTTGNTAWQVYTGSYTVPVGQTITRFSFKAISSAGGFTSVGNFVDAIQFGFLCNDDYSDAPADGNTAPNGTGTTAYGEAVHRVDNSIRLGSNIDADTTSITSLDASGDGADDDGLITLPTLTEAAAYNLQVSVVGSGRLTGWIDFAGDGTFDADDTITGNAGITSTGGTIDLPIHIPAGSEGTTFLRLRYASDTSALTASGTATDGEVEDYQITILPKITNPTNPASTPTTTGVCTTYNSTGADQLITAPIGTQGLTIKMWGAGGGHEVVGTGYSGAGGYSEAEFDTSVITGGDVFSLVVGRGGNTSGRPDEFTPGSVYGFGSVSGHDQGGGLTGLFTGNTAVSETDQARALLIAGGGGGYEHSGDAGTGVNGGNGNSSTSGGQPTMRGSTDISPSFNGLTSTAHRSGGGGGYYGGGRLPASSTYSNTFGNIQPETAGGAGGAGFVSPLAVAGRLLSTADGSNAPPNTADADYIAGIGTGSSSTTSTAGGNGLAVLCWHLYDYSDAPASYGDAVHDVSPDLQLGSSIDGDLSSLASSDASADGADDDGIATFPSLTDLDRNYQVTVNATNTTVNPGRLIAWIDFDLNGTFDADEAAARVVPAGTTAGNVVMAWSNIPPDIQAGTTYMRLRFTTDALNASSSVGDRSDGEVEDYQIIINSAGSNVRGQVYIDANSNQNLDPTETGIANTVVVLLDFFDGSCRSATTTASGEYRFNGLVDGSYEVYQAHGETTPVPQNCGTAFANNPTGYQSTTADTIIVNVAGADETDHNFGEIAGTNSPTTGNTGMGITFEPDHQSEILPGNTAFYAHVLTTEAAGKVSFTTPATDFGNIANGWTHSLYVDSNCDGDLNGLEANTIISPADEYDLVADERLCIINKVFAPANVPAQDRYEVKTVATFTYPLVSLSPVELEVTDLTIAVQNAEPATQVTPETGASRLVLTKTIENLTQGAAEVEVLSVAQPGDILKYRVYYENVGTGPITDLVINDTVPVYTGLIADSAQCATPPPPTGMGCTATENFDDLRWNFTGSLVGGAKGEVSFEVMVDR